MTMPNEEMYSMYWARKFISSIASNNNFSSEVRREASMVLRHYPNDARLIEWFPNVPLSMMPREFNAPVAGVLE